MFSKICFLICLSTVFFKVNVWAQKNKKPQPLNEGMVTYAFKNNGKEVKERLLKLVFKNNIACLFSGNNPKEQVGPFIDYQQQETLQMLNNKEGNRYTLITPFSNYEKANLTGETETILGYKCQKAKVFIRSNTIEIWFTNELSIKGTPSLGIAPGLGLILKMVRNGNFETYATKVELKDIADFECKLPEDRGILVDDATYRRKEIDSRFLTIPVFHQQQINFTDSIVNPSENLENVTYRYAGGTIVMKKIKLPAKENYNVFANLTQYSNGDAYDRTGTVFIIPMDKKNSFLEGIQKGIKELPVYKDKKGKEYQGVAATDNYLPALELMRFFTPFGVRAFNNNVKIEGYHWADSVNYKQDITDLLPAMQGEVWIGVFIGNYDRGGHTINLNFNYYPDKESKPKNSWVASIFNTLNILEMAGQTYATMFDNDSLTVTVNIPEHLKSLTLRYISTGHGGWGGGDEFNKKDNEIFLDGEKIYSFIPWRTDCATYRMYNPSSGNFGDGLSSSDLSRSNWCPGTTTNPVYIPIKNIIPGKHTFKIAIPLGKTEGTSFSAWNISGVLIGEF
ncbi:MAG TPA: PNGase F N-terminal domain-containing protein [Ferruginibacter sp.]|nr:PNGase F N-terminal domain-containing protein [Ferruginibacter sp.]